MGHSLMIFRRTEKPAPAAKTAAKKPAAAARSRTPEERRLLIESKTIRRREHIPHHSAVLSLPNGEVQLSEILARDYAVLLTDEKARKVELLCSYEKSVETTIDNDYRSISQRCVAKNYQVSRVFAERAIIGIVYEQALGRAKKSDDEQLRDSSDLQVQYDALLGEALREGVSDIHIEVRRNRALVRFRKNGDLSTHQEWPVAHARKMAMVIYQVIAEEKDVTFNEMVPQNGIVDREIEGQQLRVRIATEPAYPQGFDMIMRLLPMGQSRKVKSLSALGYAPRHIAAMEKATARPVGVTILSGTTGSGKSTSLTTMISQKIEEFEGRIKVITVEDPPEYYIEGATQVPVVRTRETKDANPFAAAIRAAMRSDPDILMVGEVRDEDSAELLIHAVQSGHQAYTTVHAPSAIGIVSRLRSLGVPMDILGSNDFLSGLIYQALVPVVCPACSVPFDVYRASESGNERAQAVVQRILRAVPRVEQANIRFRHREGCPKCRLGVVGRTVAAEVVVPDTTMITYFAEGKDALAWLYFRRSGGKTALDHGIEKMVTGTCCPYDIEAKLGLIDSQLEERGEQPDTEEPAKALAETDLVEADFPAAEGFDLGFPEPVIESSEDDWLTGDAPLAEQAAEPVNESSSPANSGQVIHAPFGKRDEEKE